MHFHISIKFTEFIHKNIFEDLETNPTTSLNGTMTQNDGVQSGHIKGAWQTYI